MSSKSKLRPLSPYMLGPYYRFEFQTLMSIAFRLSGVFMALVLAPLGCLWMLMLVMGPESFAAMQSFMASWLGTAIGWLGALAVSFHLCAGIRHLAWDTARFLEKPQIRATGWLAVFGTLVLFALTLWVAS